MRYNMLYNTAQVTLPGEGQSFALIYSIEDPAGNTAQSGVGAQVLLPFHMPSNAFTEQAR